MVATVEFERRVTGAGVLGVIVRKLSHREKPGPVVLLEVDKSSKVCFHRAILAFCLAVSLRIKRGG